MKNISGRTISANFTRPTDTTTYAAGEVVGNGSVIIFPRVAPNGVAIISQATIVTSANVATKPDLELWLFDTTVTADADNAVFTPTDAELRTLVAVIPFLTASFKVGDATSGAGGNAICDVQFLDIQVNTLINDNALYGVLVARNAYVPVADERFDIRLKVRD